MNKANLVGATCCVAMAALSFSAAAQTVSSFTVVNADSGLDPAKLASWRADLKKLDDAGVILWFTLFDDHSVP